MSQENNKFVMQDDHAISVLVSGLNTCANVVGATMGPGGSLSIKGDQYQPVFTKDGASVLDALTLDDPAEQIVVKLLRDAAYRGVRAAGDGTTTTTVLAAAMVNWGVPLLKHKTRREVVELLTNDVDRMLDAIKAASKPVVTEDDYYAVTIISTNGDEEMARVSAKAAFLVGARGKINILPGIDKHDVLNYVDGVRYTRGVANYAFLPNTGKHLTNFNVVVLTDEVTREKAEMIIASVQTNNLVLVSAPQYADEAISMFQGTRIIPMRMEGAGNAQQSNLQDLAAFVNVTAVNNADVIQAHNISSPVKVFINGTETVVYNELPKEHIDLLEEQLKEASSSYDENILETRIARLTSGVATIYVSGDTEAELAERSHRYDDATKAVLSAAKDGSSIGGGYSYLNLGTTEFKDSTNTHWMFAPIRTIMENAEIDVDEVLQAYLRGEYLNVRTFKYTDKEGFGVVDATMAQISALTTASSLARMILSTRSICRTGIPNMAIL